VDFAYLWVDGILVNIRPGRDLAIFLISRRCGKVNFGGRPPLYLGYSELNPSALKLRTTSRTPVLAGKRDPGDRGHVHALRRQQRTRRRSVTRPVSRIATSDSRPASAADRAKVICSGPGAVAGDGTAAGAGA
jgi:hypothetical protein